MIFKQVFLLVGLHQFSLFDNSGGFRKGIFGGEHDFLVSLFFRLLLLGCSGGLGGLTSEHGTLVSHLDNARRYPAGNITSVSENLLRFDAVEPVREQFLSSCPIEWLSGTKIKLGTDGRLALLATIVGGTVSPVFVAVSTVDAMLIVFYKKIFTFVVLQQKIFNFVVLQRKIMRLRLWLWHVGNCCDLRGVKIVTANRVLRRASFLFTSMLFQLLDQGFRIMG